MVSQRPELHGHNVFSLSLCRKTVVSFIRLGETFRWTVIDLPGKGRYLMSGLSCKGWYSACGPIDEGQRLI